jgi:hypothetical protein
MNTKNCSKCGKEKALEDFCKDGRQPSGRHPSCKECDNSRKRKKWNDDAIWREKKKAENKKRAMDRRREKQIKLLTILKTNGCIDCGERDPLILEFDHVRGKTEGISNMMRDNYSWEEIEVEIAKCEVRCCNCHRRKTSKERGYYSYIDLNIL